MKNLKELHIAGSWYLEYCCDEMLGAAGRGDPIRAHRHFATNEIEIKEGVWNKINYCPWCGTKFNIIQDDEISFRIADFEIAGIKGYGRTKHMMHAKDIVIVDHMSYIGPAIPNSDVAYNKLSRAAKRIYDKHNTKRS